MCDGMGQKELPVRFTKTIDKSRSLVLRGKHWFVRGVGQPDRLWSAVSGVEDDMAAEIERLREQLDAACDGDTWKAACKRCEAEIERLRDCLLKEAGRLETVVAERDAARRLLWEACDKCEKLRSAQCQWCRAEFDAGD